MIHYYRLILRLGSGIAHCPSDVPHDRGESSTESQIAFNYHASLVSFSLDQFFSLSLAFITLTLLHIMVSYFVEGPSVWVCLMFFWVKILDIHLWRKYHRSDVVFSASIRWHVILIHPITDDFHFNRWIKVVSTKLFYCKVPLLFPLL